MSTSVQALLVALLAGNVGWIAAARRAVTEEPRRGLTTLLWPLVIAGGAWLVGVVVIALLAELRPFAMISFVYLAGVLSAPIVALAVLVAERADAPRRPVPPLTTPARLAATGLLLLVPLGLYMSRVEPRRLVVDRVSVALSTDQSASDGLRLGVLADIQTVGIGPHERRAVELLLAEEPDVVLIAGDLFQGTAAQASDARDDYRELLRQLAEVPGGAFVVGGDTDDPATLAELVEGTGVRYLRSESVEVQVGDRRLLLLGMPLTPDRTTTAAALEEFRARAAQGAATVLLAHRPDWAIQFGRGPAEVDLVVAGHTHGGQVQVPLLGPLLTLSEIPRSAAGGGLHEVQGQLLYVSTGVGMEQQGAPQIRLGARPSVGILELEVTTP